VAQLLRDDDPRHQQLDHQGIEAFRRDASLPRPLGRCAAQGEKFEKISSNSLEMRYLDDIRRSSTCDERAARPRQIRMHMHLLHA